jgi:Universal stress protein family
VALTEPVEKTTTTSRSKPAKKMNDFKSPPFVVSQGIDLLVMGTVARTGLAGFIVGNTAERLLQRLVCSALWVKPDGFFTPIRLETWGPV